MILPIGSVVCVRGQKIVITGYRPMLLGKRGTLGYLGLSYPYGYLSPEKMFLFPAESVEETVSLGYTGQKDNNVPEGRKNELLPVGSIVTIGDTDKIRYMIAGYYPSNEKISGEYTVVPYPNGIIDTEEMGIIGKEQISQVIWYGHVDQEGENFIHRIPEFMENASSLMKELNDTIQFALKKVNSDKGGNDEISITME